MKDYYSVRHCTSNENHEEEVTLEYEQTLLQAVFHRPRTKRTFVLNGLMWREKESNTRVSEAMAIEIESAKNICTSGG